MKRFTMMTVLAGMMAAPSLFAVNYGNVATVGGYGPYQTGSGGEFTLLLETGGTGPLTGDLAYYTYANAVNRVQANTIQTFCVEGAEYIYSNTQFDANTGPMTKETGTVLNQGTAWLYAAFATGQLAPLYAYTGTTAQRDASADQLQRTIWALMGQEGQTAANTASDPYTQLVISHFGSFAAAQAANAGLYPVQVLQLWADGDAGAQTVADARQDQLILTGTVGHNIMPDGGMTVALLGFALTGLGIVNRKIRK